MIKIIKMFSCFLSFAVVSNFSFAEDDQIKNVAVFLGHCQVAIIDGEDRHLDCKNTLVFLTKNSKSVIGFEILNNKYSFVSVSDVSDLSKININELNLDAEIFQASGECIISPSLRSPSEVRCNAVVDGIAWFFEMTALQKL